MGSRLESKSTAVRKRIEAHTFTSEAGDEYEGSAFGGFSDYFRRKKIKLQNLDADLRARSGDKPPIFRGVVAHVNGYTQPSLNDLHALVVSHGGGFVQYLDGKTMVTHIIASNLTPKKAVEFRRYRIVKPAWIVESVNAGKLLPWNEYRVLDEGAGQRVLGFEGGQVVSQVSNRPKGYREQTDNSWYTEQLEKQASLAIAQPQDAVQGSAGSATVTSSFDESDLERLEEAARQAEQQAMEEEEMQQQAMEEEEMQQQEMDEEIISDASRSLTPTPKEEHADKDMPEAIEPAPQASTPTPPDGQPTPRTSPSPQPAGVKRERSPEVTTPRKAAKLTAEEHNTILLADPRIRKSTVVNPDFLEQYYRESRLHHLSTWKADLKSQLQALTEEKSSSQKARQKRPAGARRYVLHVDFDSFFVAVSLKKCPQYKDKPCVVAHGSGSGSEIASCNYPARKFGISNGMWMKKATELCKELEVLPYDFPAYEDASRKFYDAIMATGGIVQSVSIDEALVDVSNLCIAAGGTNGVRRDESGALREQARADEIAEELRKKVLEQTGCNVSVGIGANILLAKVALRKAKPAGQFHLRPEAVLDFIGGLEVQNLPGVAYSLGGKLEEMGIRYVKDIRECTKETLMTKIGPKTGEKLWDYARGIDKVEVGDVVTRKSVSAEVNWGVRFENQEQVDEFIESLCGELQKRLIKEKVKGRQLTVKIMRRSADAPLDPPKHLGHGKCDTYNKSVQLGVCTNDAKVICKEALSTMRGFGFTPGELRGIGVQMQKLEPTKAQGSVEGSQRRLLFKQGPAVPQEKPAPGKAEDPITDDIETPKIARTRDADSTAIPMKLLADSPSKKPLNVMGTQFMLPTQVDPAVLAELPEDIRSKLIRHTKAAVPTTDAEASKGGSDRQATPEVLLPSHSQLDPATIAALPADVRAEILASYPPSRTTEGVQAVLPQSPRKTRTLPPSKAAPARRGRPKTSRTLFDSRPSSLGQSSFALSRPATPEVDAPLDPAFLAALPADLRAEVLAQHRAAGMRRKGGIEPPAPSRRKKPPVVDKAAERFFRLPPRPKKPAFARGLRELPDLRRALGAWVAEFWDEPPFEEDVDALAGYVGEVVRQGDMDLAVRVVGWLRRLVEEDSAEKWGGDEMRGRWTGPVERVREAVRKAVKDRGLGEIDV